jgi:hypothetical protein
MCFILVAIVLSRDSVKHVLAVLKTLVFFLNQRVLVSAQVNIKNVIIPVR